MKEVTLKIHNMTYRIEDSHPSMSSHVGIHTNAGPTSRMLSPIAEDRSLLLGFDVYDLDNIDGLHKMFPVGDFAEFEIDGCVVKGLVYSICPAEMLDDGRLHVDIVMKHCELIEEPKKPKAKKTPRKKKEPEPKKPEDPTFEVVCINALGMEDSFDEGETYTARKHQNGFLVVWDAEGEELEVFAERFKELETTQG